MHKHETIVDAIHQLAFGIYHERVSVSIDLLDFRWYQFCKHDAMKSIENLQSKIKLLCILIDNNEQKTNLFPSKVHDQQEIFVVTVPSSTFTRNKNYQ